MRSGRAVIKFGGACLATAERVARSASLVLESGFSEIVVVVSAMGKTTEELALRSRSLGLGDADTAEILSMGERTSARIMAAALRSGGVASEHLEPSDPRWPLFTSGPPLDAVPDLEGSRSAAARHLETMLEESIPVICGFLGMDDGRCTTLGRGGSDITALLLGNILEAEQVILVKDTNGMMSADPNLIPESVGLETMDILDAFALSCGGARVIRHEALKYKLPEQRLRVVSFSGGSLADGGTEITGCLEPSSVRISVHEPLSAITVTGDITPRNVGSLMEGIGEGRIMAVSTGRRSTTVFASLDDWQSSLGRLHSLGRFTGVSVRNGVGMLEINHPGFVDGPGWVGRITSAVSARGINLVEVTTGESTINLFVERENLQAARESVGEALDI